VNIQPSYITFQQAKWLKEKGFDIYQPNQYNGSNNHLYNYSKKQCKLFGDLYYAPEQWQVVEW